MRQYSFKEVIDHVTSGGRAYLVGQGPLSFIKGTSNGVMWGEEGSTYMMDCPLKHCIWGGKYVIFPSNLTPTHICSYQDYTCVKASDEVFVYYWVFDPKGKEVEGGTEMSEVFNLQEWVDTLPTQSNNPCKVS